MNSCCVLRLNRLATRLLYYLQPRSAITFATTSDVVEFPTAIFTAMHTDEDTAVGGVGVGGTGCGVVVVAVEFTGAEG